MQGIFTTQSVRENDPSSLSCPQPFDLVIEMMLRFPLDPVEVSRFQSLLSPTKPKKPYAFILGHGLWNDLDLQATVNWLDGIHSATLSRAPYLGGNHWPRLFLPPSASGLLKPDAFLVTQGDKALQTFEHATRHHVRESSSSGLDHLGTWNMSVQAHKYDGVHLDLRGNLLKAMAVLNWLAALDVRDW